jgi:hypothetical protein
MKQKQGWLPVVIEYGLTTVELAHALRKWGDNFGDD